MCPALKCRYAYPWTEIQITTGNLEHSQKIWKRFAGGFKVAKSGEIDAESLMLMHSYGLLKASYQVNSYAKEIRTLSRHRENQIRNQAKTVQHMQKYMELMNIKLPEVLRNITGKSGQAILSAILSGERDTVKLAGLTDSRCKNSQETISKALEASRDSDLLFAPDQSYDHCNFFSHKSGSASKDWESL